jgi:plasmid stabilization system protein ParE
MQNPKHLDAKADALAAWQDYQAEQAARLERMARQRAMRLAKQQTGPADGPMKTPLKETTRPRGDTSNCSDKQKRQAEHIEEGYEHRGVDHAEAERRAWATVNKETGGGKKSGSGQGRKVGHASAKKGGRVGGRATERRSASERSRSAPKTTAKRGKQTRKKTEKKAAPAKRAAATRKRRAF